MRRILVCALSGLLAGGCATAPRARPAPSALELRQMQSREYEARDVKQVMKALVNVLQDEGFMIKEANTDLGILSAERQANRQQEMESEGSEKANGLGIAVGILAIGAAIALAAASASGDSVAATTPISSPTAPASETRDESFEVTVFTGNVSAFGALTRVRTNFERRLLDQKGALMSVKAIQAPEHYQSFFAKVDQGLFIEKENL